MTRQEIIESFEKSGRYLFTYDEVKDLVNRKKKLYSIEELIPTEELIQAKKRKYQGMTEEDFRKAITLDGFWD